MGGREGGCITGMGGAGGTGAPPKVGVTPGEVVFAVGSGGGGVPVCCVLELANRGGTEVAFKVKTTSPKRYSVKPNAGVCGPSATVQIRVTLSPLAVATEGKMDKFLIQVVHVPRGFRDRDEAPEVTSLFDPPLNNVTELKLRASVLPSQGTEAGRRAASKSEADALEAGGDAKEAASGRRQKAEAAARRSGAGAGGTAIATAAGVRRSSSATAWVVPLVVLLVAAVLAAAGVGGGAQRLLERLLQSGAT